MTTCPFCGAHDPDAMKIHGVCCTCAETEFPAYSITTEKGFYVSREIADVTQMIAEMEEGTQVKVTLRKFLGRHLIDYTSVKVLGTTTEDRLARLEALQGISCAPASWGITAARIQLVREKRGASLDGAKRILIANFGRPLPEEQE